MFAYIFDFSDQPAVDVAGGSAAENVCPEGEESKEEGGKLVRGSSFWQQLWWERLWAVPERNRYREKEEVKNEK